MMRALLNGFPKKRKTSDNRGYQPGCGRPYMNQPYSDEPLAQSVEEANLGVDSNALNTESIGNRNVPVFVDNSEFQQLVNNRVKLEQMISKLNDSLYACVGKEVTATLKANGVDLSSILVEKVLETIARESSKQSFGVEKIKTISGAGSTSNEKMVLDVAKQSSKPEDPGYSTKAIMDFSSTNEGKISDNLTNNIPEMSFSETKFSKREITINREYPPFCGRNAPCPTGDKRLSINSENKMRGKEVIAPYPREVFSKMKKLEELPRGKEVIGVSARKMLPKTKKLEDLGRPLKNVEKNDSKNNLMRQKVRDTLSLFRAIREDLLQNEKDKGRVDLEAAKMIRNQGKEVNTERQWIGAVPGVEVGDEFIYRVELMIVGIHRLPQGGIDYMKNGNLIVVTSIIASGGYSDEMANADALIYSGQGGNITGRNNEPPKDQEMEKGNLALKNCISTKTKVRVTRGFENKKSDVKTRITYTYDGLYTVEKVWSEKGQHGKLVFKFELRRVPGQPRVAWKRSEVKFRHGYY